MFYLSWLLDHRGEVTALVRDRLGETEAAGIAWEKARLICIAADFTRYDLHAVRLQRYPVDLLRYRCFASGHFGLEAAVSSEGLLRPASGRRVRRRGPRSAGNRMAGLAAAVDETLRGLGEDVSVVQRKASRGWGQIAGGRFAHLLAQGPPSDLLGRIARRPTAVDGALPVQLSYPPLMPRAAQLARAPRLTAPAIRIGEFHEPDPDVIALADLAVMLHQGRLHLVDVSRDQILEPSVLHPLQVECQTPALGRFLAELHGSTTARLAPAGGTFTAWDWGLARHLAAWPRVTAGRSTLSPATWRLDTTRLPDRDAPAAQWADAIAAFRERWNLPDAVYLEDFDLRLRLDLTDATDVALLRHHWDRRDTIGRLVLTEAEPDDSHGWTGGRAHEIVTLLAATTPPRSAPPLAGVPLAARPHLPGASRYLTLNLTGPPLGRRDLIATHIPDLAEDLGNPPWWLTPTTPGGGGDLLTFRIGHTLSAPDAIRRAGQWATRLTATGILADFTVVPYRPHTGLWGDGPALEASETARAADCAVLTHQTATALGIDTRVLAATGVLALADGMTHGPHSGMHWLADQPKPPPGPRLPTDLLHQTHTFTYPHLGRVGAYEASGGTALAGGVWTDRALALARYRDTLTHSGANPHQALHALITTHLTLLGQEPDGTAWRIARATALATIKPRHS